MEVLKLEKESHVEDSLKTEFSDIVYSVKVKSNAKNNEDKDNDKKSSYSMKKFGHAEE